MCEVIMSLMLLVCRSQRMHGSTGLRYICTVVTTLMQMWCRLQHRVWLLLNPKPIPAAWVQVAAYARQHRYLQQEYDTAAMRLQAVERILKQYQCSTSEELLSETSNAQADLDRYYEIAGRLACNT